MRLGRNLLVLIKKSVYLSQPTITLVIRKAATACPAAGPVLVHLGSFYICPVWSVKDCPTSQFLNGAHEPLRTGQNGLVLMDQSRSVLPLRSAKVRELRREKCTRVPLRSNLNWLEPVFFGQPGRTKEKLPYFEQFMFFLSSGRVSQDYLCILFPHSSRVYATISRCQVSGRQSRTVSDFHGDKEQSMLHP